MGSADRPYTVHGSVTLNVRGRWLTFRVEDIIEDGDVQQVLLSLDRNPVAGGLRTAGERGAPMPATVAPQDDPVVRRRGWTDDLLDAIEGNRGPVVW